MYDFFRFWWELMALNWRKTRFRFRGGKSPCQAPSDSGRAGETACEACALWDNKGRFRRVCPLLVATPDGWRCSVNAEEVRPFWGRAFAYYGGTAAGLYLLVSLAVFALFRAIGYQVSYRAVAWPPAWSHFHVIRSNYFYAQGKAALQGNRVREANIAFGLAYELDPANYDAGFALAQLWQSGLAAPSDRIYHQLLLANPGQTESTAQRWAQAIVWRGDFAQLTKLAVERLRQEPSLSPAWAHALIFSARQLQDPAGLADALALPNLPPEIRSIFRLESAALAAPFTGQAGAYARYYQIKFLIRAGNGARALELLTRYGAKISPDERVALTLDALAQQGKTAELRHEAASLLAANQQPQIYPILATHRIRYPDQELLRATAAQLSTMPWAHEPVALPALAALLCAAGLENEPVLVADLRTRMRKITGAPMHELDRTEEFLSQRNRSRRWGSFLPALPMLPLDTVYALFERDAARNRRQPHPAEQ